MLISLTLCLCGPVLDPGPLTEHILVPGDPEEEPIQVFLWLVAHLTCKSNVTQNQIMTEKKFGGGRNSRLLLLIFRDIVGHPHDEEGFPFL